jgi:hypothetical protein
MTDNFPLEVFLGLESRKFMLGPSFTLRFGD